ncbi:hypothetical protein [Halobacterium yunchengense]|uniref:hypothetical protein n=1 Tax=Halobacterium yunchengense TaxID=3108497 RepID=UPI00300B120F
MDTHRDCRATRRGLIGAIATVSLIPLSGCSALQPPNLEDLKISLEGFERPDINATTLLLPLVFELWNDGDSRIPESTIEFDALINGGHVATADTNTPPISANDLTQTTVDLRIDFGDVADQTLNAIRNGSFTLTAAGQLEASGPLGLFSDSRSFQDQINVG